MDERSTQALDAWLASLSREARRELRVLLDELVRYALRGPCPLASTSLATIASVFSGSEPEFETSGEIFGCSLEQLKDAVAETLGADAVKPPRPRSPLEALRDRVPPSRTPRFPLGITPTGEYGRGTVDTHALTYSLPQVGWFSASQTWKKGGT